jgi:hypothetical protein
MMKVYLFAHFATAAMTATNAFVPPRTKSSYRLGHHFSTEISSENSVLTGKPTGTSFLPGETIERAKKGNPIEKAKQEKDPVSAWVDVYEYARKIRAGEMTWEEVETADLDTVRLIDKTS